MESKAQPGDYVEISLMKNSYEGTLLEAPENEKGIVLLKLKSGYNFGLNKKDIVEIKILRKFSEGKEEKIEIKKEREKPNVAMIITGGTIASRLDAKKGGVSPLTSAEDFFKFYPDLFKRVNVSHVEIPFTKFSENMDFEDWKKIARTAEKFLNNPEIKGVIITQGTDTLHYSSAALSFFLRDLNKPVVFTYSQRSSDRASSDANLNLQCAALAAISDIAEVMLVGHASSSDDFCYAMPGTKTRKLHTSRRDAFRAVNSEPFAKIFPSGEIHKMSDYNLRNKGRARLDCKFEEKVALLKFYPGQDPDILDYYLKNKYKGIIVEFFGLGQIAGKGARKPWLSKIKELVSKGVIVCAAPQTIYGRLDPYVYSSAREFLDAGVVYLEDMLAETAFVKLGWVLGHEEWAKNKEKIREKMLENFSREINRRISEEEFI